jgi:hypothetical protein
MNILNKHPSMIVVHPIENVRSPNKRIIIDK